MLWARVCRLGAVRAREDRSLSQCSHFVSISFAQTLFSIFKNEDTIPWGLFLDAPTHLLRVCPSVRPSEKPSLTYISGAFHRIWFCLKFDFVISVEFRRWLQMIGVIPARKRRSSSRASRIWVRRRSSPPKPKTRFTKTWKSWTPSLNAQSPSIWSCPTIPRVSSGNGESMWWSSWLIFDNDTVWGRLNYQ